MTNDVKEVKEDDLNKALSEIDVLDKDDKEIYRVDSETFLFSKIEYKLIEDYKEAFDIDMMEERYTDYLLKYDYIVGDIAYEKLRLRGFYDDHRKGVPIDMKISNLEDYLIEFCNFGSSYFVFERSEKKKSDPESYFKRSKKPSQNKRRNSRNKRNNQKPRNNQPNKPNQGKQANAKKDNKPNTKTQPKQINQNQQNRKPKNAKTQTNQNNQKQQNKNQINKNQPQKAQNNKPQAAKKQKDFQVVKKQEAKPTVEQTKTVATKKSPNNKKFKIRKKKTDD